MNSTAQVSGACPTHFRATCSEVSQGGVGGYLWVGRKLASIASGLLYQDFEDDVHEAKLNELADAIDRRHDARVLGWFERELPRCMKLVPRNCHEQFLKGVYRYVDEGNDVTEI